ncbi:hypothetical protein N7536_002347 [Penicillium majusculum]|uniref:Uncharacterized protein n=1 Tax=Penicillium solitum TaxID=60172 RepID=A0A1V6QVF3_9EURO|nr:uncharacterized protein PENSOL_c034G04621 [Penicillium solitum]KAJ5699334.1 hypothetical protein N7536_002347 [Penicillium majusculum]OQD93185.1 hypothetical protein PENSOL_c034G04621 [Penicillium solitum]
MKLALNSPSENLTSTTAEASDSVVSITRTPPTSNASRHCPLTHSKPSGYRPELFEGIIEQQKGLPIEVVKYLRFRDVPPSIAGKLSSSSTQQMFNHGTQSMIVNLVTGAHQTASRDLFLSVRRVGLGCVSKVCRCSMVAHQLPGGQVKLVVIVSINRKVPEITFETVVLDPVVNSLHKWPYVPTVRQSITTSRPLNQPDAYISVYPAVPLTIRLEELFCRQPALSEHDIDISIDRLKKISATSGTSKTYKFSVLHIVLLA